MVANRWLLYIFLILIATARSWAQCDQLRPQRDVSFNTDQDCAPVTVTQFTITYYFNVPQDPNRIQIRYVWNDPANTVTNIGIGNGLVPGAGNMSFTATSGLTYNDNDNGCSILPTAFIVIDGAPCPTSAQQQSAFFWGTEEQGNGVVAMTPATWQVCFDNPVVDARFQDASEFNCNINVEPDNPNQAARHVQFVYGTNHNPAATVRDLVLNDGGPVPLTTAAGTLASTTTRGTVTAAYFGPIQTIPFPANGPAAVSFPMNAPANPLNLVGNRFEVTLYNWNVCNPWNGDVLNPNYEDAVLTRGYIEIVNGPQPSFFTQDANGVARADFCIGEQIRFQNTTPSLNSFQYTWRFYDDPVGTTLLSTSTARNPFFTFTSGGQKLVRVTARNAAVQGTCEESFEALVNITPSLAAEIGITDLSGNPLVPDFCQEFNAPLTDFDVRFNDVSTGSATPGTRWRWEFYDPGNNLVFSQPAGTGFSSTQTPFIDRVFTNPGVYRVRLRIRDVATDCESVDEVSVRVFEKPQPQFVANPVCEGSAMTITQTSVLNPIAGEQIVSWEWDMNYDGVTFAKEVALDNRQTFDYTYPGPGTYEVALRVTTNLAGCSSMSTQTVEVHPTPTASFTPNMTSGCSELTVDFTNHAVNGQPDAIKEFIWEIDAGTGFQVDSIQRPTDPGFSDVYSRTFVNTATVDREFHVRLRVVTVNDCEFTSPSSTITVFPQPRSGFVSLNYSPFDSNCSPVSVDFRVDNQTQALSPTNYTWRISDTNGIVDEISTGTTPTFTYNFVNATAAVKDFFVTLRATLPSACYGDSTRTIRIAPLPTSTFAVDTLTYGCDRVLLRLDALQKGFPQYEWTIAINNFVVYNSTTDGDHLEYEVTRSATTDQTVRLSLRTTNLANCVSPVTSTDILVPRTDAINASFTAAPMEQTLPASTVTITNMTTPGPWTYRWDFGDGTTSSDPNVASHTYDSYGEYTITLRVSNNDCVSMISRDVRVNPIPPILDFDFFPPTGCAPLTVSFVNLSQYADPTSYFWSFGAGEGTSRATDPTYTYLTPGIYSVTLSATNVLGDTVSVTKEGIIHVMENPVAQFAVYPTTPLNVPGEILYTDNRSRNATEYLWDFGDGNTSTDPEPQHKYTTEGTFTVTLVARSSNGCADTTSLVSGVTTVKHGQLLVPNAFVPNTLGPGSGNVQNNEVFLPLIQNVTKYQMMVFNRWGELMFESTDPQVGWDGYYKGRLCPQDVYIYRITVEYDNGRTITRTGDINLLR